MKKIILLIIILAMVAGIVGLWYSQKNTYSREVIKLEILGPAEVDVGAEIEYVVKYKNNGNIRVEDLELIFEYPEYSIVPEGKSLRQTLGKDELGDAIYPGEERVFYFKAWLIGEEDESKEAKVWLSYRPKDLKARYESDTVLTTIIKKVPLVFEFDISTKVGSEKNFVFRLNYFSNIEYLLSDLRCILEHPSGFEVVKATPLPMFIGEEGKTEWGIASLNQSDGGRFEITGKFKADVGEEKIFKAKLGVWRNGEFILLKEATKVVSIADPSLYIYQQINGSPKYISNVGDLLHYEIFFKNIGSEPLIDMFLVARLDGKAFDFQTMKSTYGNFQLGDSSIFWDGNQISELKFLDVKEGGKVDFWIKLKQGWDIADFEDDNSVLTNKIILGQAREEFLTKVNSKLDIEQKVYFEDEVFGNSGSIPPQTGQSTTYTVIWQAKNYYNLTENVKVKAILPEQVRLTSKIFPEEARMTYDSKSREIVWEIGDIEAGKGVLDDGVNCAFQIVFIPTEEQRGSSAILINQARISGRDEWTGQIIEAVASSTDTILPDDKTMIEGSGIVQ